MRLDQKVNVEDEEAYEMSRRLAREEGVFVGMSSGAAMVIAVREAEKMTAGTIVTILPDGGERYLSTPLFAVKEKVDLKFFNTLSRSKEPFEPVLPGKVSMYSCGPTAHAPIHVGECRRFVFADLLSRYLEFRGYSVTHVMNITDLDDKTILGSEREGEEISRFTEKHIRGFKKDCETIGIKPADQYPRASQHVEDMVLVAKKLVQKGYAYEKLRSIYFNISRFAEYGRLSGIDIDKIKVGTTVDLDEYEKDNPRDFTLMKRAKLSELKRGIYTKTDWGNVRPSWHIQCAAMSMKYLGETYDIHTASRELVFPHHENKLAIAMSLTGKPLARYWLHCDRVLVQGKKVDEKGIAPIVSDLVQMGYTGREIRYWLLSTHYHKPIAYATERLDEARSALKRLDTCVDTLLRLTDGAPYHELDQLVYDVKQGFINAMDDNLNISAGMASIFKNVKKINLLLLEQNIDPHGASKIVDTLRGIDTVLGIFKFSAALSGSKIQKLIQKRETARAVKNWDLADKIRDQLQSSGVCVRDQKTSQGEGIQK
jgi:cysteinyl-tRNA synthetase